MTVVEGPKSAGLVARVQAILLRPKAEWKVIEGESASVQGLYTGYACILAAIPAVCNLIGRQVFGYGGFLGITLHPPLIASVVGAVVTYVLSLISIFILALVIDALAPSFDGQKNQIQALKVAVYSSTAGWVAGIFGLFPPLAIIGGLCALYGLYLLYLGLPRLMKAPEAKALGYTVVTIVVAIVLYVIVGVVVAGIGGMAMLGGAAAGGAISSAQNGGTVRVGGANVDLGKLQASAAAMTTAADAMQKGAANGKVVAAIDPEKLKALLPDSVDGLPRTELNAQSAGAGGVSSSNAEAVYAKDSARITVSVTDLAAAGAFAGMANTMNVQSSRQTPTGYEKVGRVDGRMTTEKWDSQSKSGTYQVLVADRFVVEANGSANSVDELKSAVAAVGPDRLEGMAKA